MNVSTGPVVVPDVWGLKTEAITAIAGAGLAVGTVEYEPSAEVPSDSVKHTRPWAGTSVAAGSAVALVVSTGPLVTVPNLANGPEDAAREALDAAYLTIRYITKQSSATVPSGLVISQNPDAGTSVAAYSAVSFVVSTGPPVVVTVPNVMNRTLEDAERALRDAGLEWGKIPLAYSPTVPAGSVAYQSPSGGTLRRRARGSC